MYIPTYLDMYMHGVKSETKLLAITILWVLIHTGVY